jgi:hypothetical protein
MSFSFCWNTSINIESPIVILTFELLEDTLCLLPCKLLLFIGGNGKLLNLCEDFMFKVSQRSNFFCVLEMPLLWMLSYNFALVFKYRKQ